MRTFEYLYDYYPESITEVTDEQKRIRELVQGFMSGEADPELLDRVIFRVKEIVKTEDIDVVCFAPGTTGAKTILRFSDLAEKLDRELDCDVFMDAVTLKFDADPITHKRYYQCNNDRVKGKIVLVIGGVSTTGESMMEINSLLEKNLTKAVYGLFIAKTVL